MADINLVVGGSPKFGNIDLKDNVTGDAIASTFSNLVVTNNHPELATIEANPSSTQSVSAAGISAGSGSVVISVDCSYTDAGDNQPKTERLSITKTFEVVGAPHGAHIEINFP